LGGLAGREEMVRTATISRVDQEKGWWLERCAGLARGFRTEKFGVRLGGDGNDKDPGLRGFFGGGEIGRSCLEAEASGSVMRLVEFDSNVSPTRILRCEERGAATAEWV
jgi:hypothetical protein